MALDLRDRLWQAAVVALGAVLLVASLAYVRLLAPIVDPELVVAFTASLILASILGLRIYLDGHPPLDPERPSSRVLAELVDDLVVQTGAPRPRIAMDDSRLARAVANVGAVEVGPRSETILFTEQLVSDLEAGRFGLQSLRGVVLHELGHLRFDHSYLKLWTSLGERFVRVGALAALVALVVSDPAREALIARPWLALAIALGPFAVASVLAVVSRTHEMQADDFAIRHAAGRELLDFLAWIATDLAPFHALDQSGVPRDPGQRRRIREGLERLIAEAEAANDEERAAFMREALIRLREREEELREDLPWSTRARLVLRRLGRSVGLVWLGVVPWNRSHPPLPQRMARIAAEIGASA